MTAFYEMAEAMPGDTGNYGARIMSLEQTGDAAVIALAEEGCWGTVSFVDYFLLARIHGNWKIVCKLFAHTGGEPPAALAATYRTGGWSPGWPGAEPPAARERHVPLRRPVPVASPHLWGRRCRRHRGLAAAFSSPGSRLNP